MFLEHWEKRKVANEIANHDAKSAVSCFGKTIHFLTLLTE